MSDRTCLRIDVRVLIGDDESLETGVLPALMQYNLEQLTVAEVPGAGHNVCLEPYRGSASLTLSSLL